MLRAGLHQIPKVQLAECRAAPTRLGFCARKDPRFSFSSAASKDGPGERHSPGLRSSTVTRGRLHGDAPRYLPTASGSHGYRLATAMATARIGANPFFILILFHDGHRGSQGSQRFWGVIKNSYKGAKAMATVATAPQSQRVQRLSGSQDGYRWLPHGHR